MGFWSKLVGQKATASPSDPLIEMINRMMDREAERQQAQNVFLIQLMDQQKERDQLLQSLVGQYVNTSTNVTTSLDQRMFEKEQNFDWVPFDQDPFKGLGDGE